MRSLRSLLVRLFTIETVPAGEQRKGTFTYMLKRVIKMFLSGITKAAGCPANRGPGRFPVKNMCGAAVIGLSPLIVRGPPTDTPAPVVIPALVAMPPLITPPPATVRLPAEMLPPVLTEPPVIEPLAFMFPPTSSFAAGLLLLMPTFPLGRMANRPPVIPGASTATVRCRRETVRRPHRE